jgi:hypothetical protein
MPRGLVSRGADVDHSATSIHHCSGAAQPALIFCKSRFRSRVRIRTRVPTCHNTRPCLIWRVYRHDDKRGHSPLSHMLLGERSVPLDLQRLVLASRAGGGARSCYDDVGCNVIARKFGEDRRLNCGGAKQATSHIPPIPSTKDAAALFFPNPHLSHDMCDKHK